MAVGRGRGSRGARTGALIAAVLVGAAGLSACVNNTDTGSAASGAASKAGAAVKKDAALASQVPQALVKKGTITVGTDPTYAPNEYKDDSGNIVGFDIDLFDAVAGKLGLKVSYQGSTFDNIIPGVQGGKYDVGVSSFTDNAEREQVVDFVTYYSAGTQWAQPKGGSVDPDNACGKNVAVQTGTVQETDDLPARSQKCTAAGQPGINVQKFDDQGQATNAVVLGKADAMLADSPITAYAVKQSAGKLVLDGNIYDAAPYGYAIGKNEGTLKEAVRGSVDALIKDGTYKQILDKWGLAAGAVTSASVNAAASG